MKAKKLKPTRNIKKIHIAKPEARDEGPRLIPLRPVRDEEKHYQKILELADILLKNPKS